jgi:predicted N-acetyltransferase YhbS
MLLRQERPSDYDEVFELVKISFSTNSDDDGTVPGYLNDLRKKDVFISELSLVAENEEGKIIGQIVLYKTIITTSRMEPTELLLSPICVHPDYFRHGVARALINEAFNVAKTMGYNAVFLCGDPKIYKKFGFLPSYKYNIFHISDVSKNAEWSLVYELSAGRLEGICGTVNTV